MCGLLVEIGEKASAELFAEALLSMAHRGPDAEGTTEHNHNDKKVFLGHRRLSIIDTDQRSNQPMSSICGRFQIVFNGEIYNFRQIKDKHLSDQCMATESDTEVLLNSFINHGNMIFDELIGMYAVAIYDSKEGVLTVARDPFGIKPMYIFNDNERLIFSSEIKGLQGLNVKPLVDKNQLRQFLAHGFL